ncbi:hydroxyisourate hydrolase [Gracilibacillus sp. HCP3S3_G5_1]|uniref:hydroxyisourate hydrolase n=1 Tax=unclassified Gracilibacillus TaxID=2625209 RepID=UPI003F89E349
MTGLTTHVLDLTHGKPGGNINIDLYRIVNERKEHLKSVVTNQDGRVNEAILTSEELTAGEYEFLFHIGEYFREQGVEQQEPSFLEMVPVRFGIPNPSAHYHVPLLISPWGYQVYRGS